MRNRIIKKYDLIFILIIMLFPLSIWPFINRDFTFILIHQVYYLPMGSWMAEPFFKADDHLLFWPLPLGRIITPIVYSFVYFCVRYLITNITIKMKR